MNTLAWPLAPQAGQRLCQAGDLLRRACVGNHPGARAAAAERAPSAAGPQRQLLFEIVPPRQEIGARCFAEIATPNGRIR